MSEAWKMAPREPTFAMRRAADERQATGHPHIDIWCAMWDAAPAPPSSSDEMKEALEVLRELVGALDLAAKYDDLPVSLAGVDTLDRARAILAKHSG